MEKTIVVNSYFGKTYTVEYSDDETLDELKGKLLSIIQEPNVNDFDFVYAGRRIKNTQGTLGELINGGSSVIFLNAKGVHGGCSVPVC